jgi:hypothetical protein
MVDRMTMLHTKRTECKDETDYEMMRGINRFGPFQSDLGV